MSRRFLCYRARRRGVGDAGGIEPACTHAPDGARPHGVRKDALCRAQVASVAAGAAAASLGVKPQAEAPHSAPDAPRRALRRRLRRRTTCSARARTQRHRLVAGSAGTSWPDLGVRAQLLRSARASRRAAKGTRAQVDGKWRDGWEPLRPPTRLAAGRSGAEARGARRVRTNFRTHARRTN